MVLSYSPPPGESGSFIETGGGSQWISRLPTVLDVESNRYQTVKTKRVEAYPVNAVALTGSSP